MDKRKEEEEEEERTEIFWLLWSTKLLSKRN